MNNPMNSHSKPRRPEAAQLRIDRFIFELTELQRNRIRQGLNGLIEYARKYEGRRPGLEELVNEAEIIAPASMAIKGACSIADESPDDIYCASRAEINQAVKAVYESEARAALLEEAEIDRLAQEDMHEH